MSFRGGSEKSFFAVNGSGVLYICQLLTNIVPISRIGCFLFITIVLMVCEQDHGGDREELRKGSAGGEANISEACRQSSNRKWAVDAPAQMARE
jgi:hypothetical protein